MTLGELTSPSLFTFVSQRCTGPGGVYNIGNLLALGGGVTIQTISSPDSQTLSVVVWHFLFGNIGASCLTLSMFIHLACGEVYHHACRDPNRPRRDLMKRGDILSGVGAVFLTIAVASYGDGTLALIAGALFGIGKFGSAVFSETPALTKRKIFATTAFRVMPVVSRIPSLAALVITLFLALEVGSYSSDVAATALMIGCYLIWLRADYLLLTMLKNDRFTDDDLKRVAFRTETYSQAFQARQPEAQG